MEGSGVQTYPVSLKTLTIIEYLSGKEERKRENPYYGSIERKMSEFLLKNFARIFYPFSILILFSCNIMSATGVGGWDLGGCFMRFVFQNDYRF